MRLALVALATLLSLAVALGTRPYAHPDEQLHVEAFRYYAAHAWPPDLDSDALIYDAYGTSKVYARDIAYVILGAPGVLLERALAFGNPALAFRLPNVALLAVALIALLRTRSPLVPSAAFAVALASIPQVLYVFGCANSDAWGVFLSILLLVQALRLWPMPAPWPLRETLVLGVLSGLLLASKDNFLLALGIPAIALGPRFVAGMGRRGLFAFALSCALFPLPYKIAWPRTQPDFALVGWRMAEKRAQPGFKPSDPSLAQPQRVDSALEMLLRSDFVVRTAQSSWGVYGHMTVFHAKAVYAGVALLALANVALTLKTAARRWPDIPIERRRMLLGAPALILLNFALSLRWSVEVFYQPQGRYLFPSLIPALLLVAGTVDLDTAERPFRFASAVIALLLCAWSLLFLALPRLA